MSRQIVEETFQIEIEGMGVVNYTRGDIISFATPIIGYPFRRQFLLVGDDKELPFYRLVSVEEPELIFVLLDMRSTGTDYSPDIPRSCYEVLAADANDATSLNIFSVVRVHKDISKATVNLRAPILINLGKRFAMQYVLDDEGLDMRAKIFTDE